jgi:hypothetical protein
MFKRYLLPSLAYSLLFTACDSAPNRTGAPLETLPSAKSGIPSVNTDGSNKQDTVFSWDSFKKGSALRLKENRRHIDDFKLQISIGIGPHHDMLFKSINKISYKNEMLEDQLSAFKMGNNADFVTFYTQFNVTINQVKDSLDNFVLN